jgi:hypothetical protein
MAFQTNINTVKRFKLGTRRQVDNKEFIYLQGVASTIVGSWVTFEETYLSLLTVATSRGPVAVAMAAVTAGLFGWYQIYGTVIGSVATGADNANVWTTATPGRVDNTDVTLQIVNNAVQRSATASNLATFQIQYPFCQLEIVN